MEDVIDVGTMELSNTLRRDDLYGFEMKAGDLDLRRQLDRPKRTCYDIKQLWQRSHEIINLSLQGLNNKDIAKCLSISHEAVSACLNSELGVKKLSEMRKLRDGDAVKMSKRINELVEKAVKTYNDIFDAPTDQVSYKLKKETADTVVLAISSTTVSAVSFFIL